VVNKFKLLGVTIDSRLNFADHVSIVSRSISSKLFAIKKIFYLSFNVKIQFFKTFILPHFDYCSSLFVYMSKCLIEKLCKIYNYSILLLLNLNLNFLSDSEQYEILKEYDLFPFKFRLLIRFSTFSFKIFNKCLLNNIFCNFKFKEYGNDLRDSTKSVVTVPQSRTVFGSKRISVFLAIFCNKIMKFSYNHNFVDFKCSLYDNLLLNFVIFDNLL
jgi:hypothetical protein